MRSSRQAGDRSEARRPLSERPQSNWQLRIDERQRENKEHEVLEAEDRQKTSQRSDKRNDAMRRVMERQAQRQQDVEALEA